MKKSIRDLCIKEARSNSTNNLLSRVKRVITPTLPNAIQKSLSKLTSNFLKSSVNSIASSKRYSILSVPKTPNTYLLTSPDITPQKQSEVQDILSVSTTVDTTRTSSQGDYKGNFKFSQQNSRIRVGGRYRKNPNQENLKFALQEIEKNPSKKFIICEKHKEKMTPVASKKSDIEVLLESQGNLPRISKIEEKPKMKVRIADVKEIKEPIEMSVEIASQVSDPSPVREKKFEVNLSQTPKRKKRLAKNNSKLLNFLTKSKAGREFIEKYQDNKELSVLARDTPTVLKESVNRTLVDYRQESLKILKDTSFFANKIMKAIRCPGRIKKCYYAN